MQLFDETKQQVTSAKSVRLIDVSGVLYAAIYGLFEKSDFVTSETNPEKKTLPYATFRQGLIGSFLYYKNMFHAPDETILCVDSPPYWRKQFIDYKAQRKAKRDSSDLDFKSIHKMLDDVIQEVKDNINWKVIKIKSLEADDVIGILSKELRHADITIISTDKDLVQLQKYSNVKQWSPITKKWVTPKESPRLDLMDKVLRGDAKDAVPNIYSSDDFFTNKLAGDTSKQKAITKKLLTEAIKCNFNPNEFCDTADMVANFHRNQLLLDFDFIPTELQQECLTEYENYQVPSKMKLQNYLIKNRLGVMLDKIFEF